MNVHVYMNNVCILFGGEGLHDRPFHGPAERSGSYDHSARG